MSYVCVYICREEEEDKGKAELPDYLKNLPEHQRRAFERGREGGGVSFQKSDLPMDDVDLID